MLKLKAVNNYENERNNIQLFLFGRYSNFEAK